MIRRQLISDELRYSHQTSPRKVRTFRGPGQFQPTLLYRRELESNQPDGIPARWIGRILIPWNGNIIQSYIRTVQLGRNDPAIISEFEIANYAKPNTYRILYVDGDIVKSKPQIGYVPNRLNVLVDPVSNIIQSVLYF